MCVMQRMLRDAGERIRQYSDPKASKQEGTPCCKVQSLEVRSPSGFS